MSFISYILLYPIVWVISLLPLRLLYLISKELYFLVYYIIRYRRKVVYKNLQNSFPEKSPKEIQKIAKSFYRYFCRLIIEIIKLITISKEELKSRIKYKNVEILNDLYKKGRHCIIITAHYGNWEWLTGLTDYTLYKTMCIYKPLSNKYLNKLFIKVRTKTGADVVPMKSTIKAILKYQREKTLTLSCFISDQSPVRHHIQYWTKFLNQNTPIFLGPEKIARQTNQSVVYFNIMPIKPGYYEVEVIKLFEDVSQVDENTITEAHVRLLEQVIKNKPEYWLWSHRRWKHSHLKDKM